MSNFLSNLSGNVPPKARIVLGLSAVAAVGGVVAFFNMYGGGDKKDNSQIPGQAVLVDGPNDKKITKTKPGDELLIPDGSPIAIQIEESRQDEIQTAKKKGGGFADRLDFANSKRVIEKTSRELGADVNVEGLGTIDDELNTRKAIEREKKRLAKLQRERAKSKLTKSQRKELKADQQAIVVKDSNFLQTELAKFEGDAAYSSYINRSSVKHEPINSGYSAYSKKSEGNRSEDTGTNGTGRQSSGTSASNYVNKYIRDPSKMAKVDVSQVDRFRGLASNSGASSNSDSQEVSAYEDLVSPMGGIQNAGKTRINIGEMYYGILQIGVNTDEIGPVRAMIPGEGKLREAVLIGEPVRIGEKASIRFTAMSKDGKDLGVVAIALDPDTLRPALADNVDRHIFDRYFKLALAAAGSGYVDALTGSRSKTYSDGSREDIIERLPDSSDQLAAAIGKVGEVMIPKFERNFERPPTVEINSNRDIIIMFLQGFEI